MSTHLHHCQFSGGRTKLVLIAAVLLIIGADSAKGQAGRRPPPRQETPPQPGPAPSPTPTPPKTAKPQYSLKVVRDIPQVLNNSFPFPENMQRWTVDRLRKSPLLDVAAGDQANHNEAVRLAKAETQVFIVWVQLEENPFVTQLPSGRHPVPDEVRINFEILAPVTGKTKYSGTVFLNQSTRGVEVKNINQACYPGVRADDYLLLEASLEVAARIMDHFSVPVPAAC